MGIVKKKAQVIKKAEKIFTPTQNRIFSMDKNILIRHYILIYLKESSLSAEERRLVKNRVSYGLTKGTITEEELEESAEELQRFLIDGKV